MTTTKEASERSMETRLGQAGRKLDGIVAKARHAHNNGKDQIGRRVDALRAREARTRTRLRELRAADQAAWDAHVAELDRELDELEVEMAIADARLDAELAADDAAFAAAVDTELDAWSSRIDAMQARAAAAKHHARAKREAAILRVRERRAAAKHELQAFRRAHPTCREPHRRRHQPVRRLNAVRLPPHPLVRILDHLRRRGLPLRAAHYDRLARSHLPVHLHPDQPNRADERRQVVADQQWQMVQDEEQQNEELLRLSNQLLELTRAIHASTTARATEAAP
jgi:hypothetical protein